jgi:MFS family permease
LVVYSVTGFSGYALLLPVAPLWAVHGGAGAAGAGLVNGVLLATTVIAQLAVPWTLRTLGHGRTMALGLVLMAAGAALVVADDLTWILACSVVRGVGFGILTVTGSAVVGHLAPAALRGRMVGVYGLAVAVPNLVLLPAGVPAVDALGFAPVLLVAALPLLGIPAALALGHLVRPAPAPAPVALVPGAPAPVVGRAPVPAPQGLLAAVVPPTAVLLAATMAGGALLTFLPQVTSSGTAGVALLLMGVAAAASRFGAGHLADAGPRGGHGWLAPLLVVTAAGTTACAWGAGDGPTVWLLAGALLCGTGYGALQNLTLVSAFQRAGPGRVDETSTVWNVGFDGGTALGAVVVGVVASVWGFPVAFACAGAGCVLALVAARLSRPA